jgi:outer membrane autotransporter protein
MYEPQFAENGRQGLSGINAQLTLVQQMLNPRPVNQLAANQADSIGGSGLWGSVGGHWTRTDSNAALGSPDWSQNSKSVTLGYQSGGASFRWGISGGYHEGDIDFSNRSASGDNDGWNVGLNALWQSENYLYANGILAYGHESDSLTRNDGLGTNKSDFNAQSYAALLEVGKRIDKKTCSLTPYISLLGAKTDRDAISENGIGAGVASSLNINGESHNYLTSTLGLRISRTYQDKNGRTRGGAMLGVNWQHQFSGADFPVTASLQSAPVGSGSFTTYGTSFAGNSVGVQLGGYVKFTRNLFGFLNYNGNFGGDQQTNSVTAGLQYGF